MRFALLGDHADGLEMARALALSGRHQLAVYSGSGLGTKYLERWGLQPDRVGDLEEVLADPRIEAVIVAGRPAERPGQLRRALQSERHVLCVCPVDDSPDIAYEAAMAQADVRTVLFPLLPEALHPGFHRLAALARSSLPSWKSSTPTAVAQAVTHLTHDPGAVSGPVGLLPGVQSRMAARLVEVERWSADEILLESEEEGHKPGFPGWEILRLVGGEIGEVFALCGPEEVERGEPLLLAGQFVGGGLFQATYLPLQAEARLRVALVNRESRAELLFAQGWPGPARLNFIDDQGQERVESWQSFNPWEALVVAFDAAWQNHDLPSRTRPSQSRLESLGSTEAGIRPGLPSTMAPAGAPPAGPSWQDAIRGLELDDAVRRSVHRRRASTLEYQEVTEDVGFKGTMTLVGCSMLWISVMLLILSAWQPWLGWIIAPVFGIFLAVQLLRWLVPREPNTTNEELRIKNEE